jgi:hypothetical protein
MLRSRPQEGMRRAPIEQWERDMTLDQFEGFDVVGRATDTGALTNPTVIPAGRRITTLTRSPARSHLRCDFTASHRQGISSVSTD